MKIKILITSAVIFLLYIVYSFISNSHYAKANKFNAKGITESKNNYAESDMDFKKAISYKFREHIPLTNLGINSIHNRDYSLAHDYFEKALKEKKDYIPAKYNDAIALFEWGKNEYNPEKCNIERVMIFWNQSQRIFQEIASADSFFQIFTDPLVDKSRENSELIPRYIGELKNGCKPLNNQNQKEDKKNSESKQNEDKNQTVESEKENIGDENKERKNDSGKAEKENLSQKLKSEQHKNRENEEDSIQKLSENDSNKQSGKKPNAPKNHDSQNNPDDRGNKKSKEGSGFRKFAEWIKNSLNQTTEKKNETSESRKENSGDGYKEKKNNTGKREKEDLSKDSRTGQNKNQASEKDSSQFLPDSDKNNQLGKNPNVPNEDSSRKQNLANRPWEPQQNQDQNKNSKFPDNNDDSRNENSKHQSGNTEAQNSTSTSPHHEEENSKNLDKPETPTEHLEHEYGQKKLSEKDRKDLSKELERIQKGSYKQKYYRTRLEKSEKDRPTEETRKLLKEALW